MKLTHDLIERKTGLLILLVVLTVAVGGLVEIVPLFFQRSTTEPVAGLKPYAPLQLAGRDVYVREGCYNCHSQMIRPFRAETERYGHYSVAGEFVYDRPFLWGSKRSGPDLWRLGGKYNHAWHWAHMEDPPTMSQGSTMPRYPWLYDDATDYASLPSKIGVLSRPPLFTPYSREEREDAIGVAKAQARKVADELKAQIADPVDRARVDADREIIALIAYLQRLGTDLPKGGAP